MPFQDFACGITLQPGQRQEHVLGRNILVLEVFGFVKSALNRFIEGLAELLLGEPADLGQATQCRFYVAGQRLGTHPETRQQRRHNAVTLFHQRAEQVHGLNLLLLVPPGDFLRLLQGFLRFYGQFVESHHRSLSPL